MDQVNYTAQKACKAFHFIMRVLRKVNRNTKRLAYASLVSPVLECGSACWDPCRGGQINALDRVQQKAVQFTNYTKYSDWKTSVQLRKISILFSILQPTMGNGLGQLYATFCEGLTS